MRNNKCIAALLLLLAAAGASAQDELYTSRPTGRGQYSLVAYIGGGMGQFLSQKVAPTYLQTTPTRINPMGTLRILWHPDHLLKAGWETGYVTFYKYGTKDSAGRAGTVALNAIPVLLEFSMSLKKRFNIFAGSGIYILNTKLDYGGKVNANKLTVGWMAAASYILPLGTQTGLGAEAKWLYSAEAGPGILCGQLQLVWRFLKW